VCDLLIIEVLSFDYNSLGTYKAAGRLCGQLHKETLICALSGELFLVVPPSGKG
jgi:hypothetical protein